MRGNDLKKDSAPAPHAPSTQAGEKIGIGVVFFIAISILSLFCVVRA